jgi:hypothetical protein
MSATYRPPDAAGQEPTMFSPLLGRAAKHSPKVQKSAKNAGEVLLLVHTGSEKPKMVI